ncbi:hypothetical protein METH_04935 [Leisingera methylohalidivorans DSM 14336]|uniref:Uncharacterized protein n=1 Tax=Leisingera methylohalidivorans DSM 14336 TaxID=999552 RepID=V9VYS4_9RHOB|nr:hypothetical protein METH_04935 [Leisingera methylohalidivorans DSM 14336]
MGCAPLSAATCNRSGPAAGRLAENRHLPGAVATPRPRQAESPSDRMVKSGFSVYQRRNLCPAARSGTGGTAE